MAMATVTNTKLDWAAIGAYIADKRKASGLTQGELADAVRRKQPDISLLERGLVQPTVETLVNVCEALGINVGRLLERFRKK